MTELVPSVAPAPEPTGIPDPNKGVGRAGDRIFGGAAKAAGILVIALVAAVAAFLVKQAVPALLDDKSSFLFSRDWDVSVGNLHFGIAGMLWTTVLVSVFAMVLAV